jgi:HipA-like protein
MQSQTNVAETLLLSPRPNSHLVMRLAVEHTRRMKGGTQAHLMRCDDDAYYVIKFKNNPQHLRTLANEMFATRLAARMGICVPEVDVIEVRSSLIERTNELVMEMPKGRSPCATGKQFGSKFPGNPSMLAIVDGMPDVLLDRVTNIHDFLGIFVFDKWTCQTDKRQAIFVPRTNPSDDGITHKSYRAMMIDQGLCFNGGSWNFPDAPLHSLYANRRVYQSVVGIETFDRWIDRLENEFTLSVLYEEAEQVPPEWYGDDHDAWNRLIERLFMRRTRVRELIWSARNAVRDVFPNWNTRIRYNHSACERRRKKSSEIRSPVEGI